jgi:MFS transporter, UMF1 family
MKPHPVAPREIVAWAFYDFANSGYTTVVLTAVFNAYFVNVVAAGATWATFAWTLTLSVSYALTMLLGPWLGARADAQGRKKPALVWTTLICVAATAALALAGPGALLLACVLIVVSNVAYSLGENLCAGFLPELAPAEKIAKISAFGWSFGYVGGLVALGVSLIIIKRVYAETTPIQISVGTSMIAVAILFGLASLPMFFVVKERAVASGNTPTFAAVLEHTKVGLAQVRAYPELQRFMWFGLACQAGVAVVITLAAVYAQAVLGFKTEDTIQMLIVVNVTAAIGAAIFGFLQDRLGHRHVLLAVVVVWFLGILVLALKTDVVGFWIAANLAGLALGACQSGGRALVGYLAPEAQRAQFFGVWGFYTRAAAIIGPLSYGVMTLIFEGNHRLAMLFTGGFFVIAFIVLAGVNVERGRARVSG